MFYRTVACLPALVGAWRHRGGGLARSTGAWTSEHVDQRALTRPDLLAGRRPRRVNMSRLGEVLTALDDPPVMATVVWSSNPAVVVPNAELVRRGLARDDLFTVVHDQFVTDTARYADIVLPATTQIESSDVVMPWGHLYLGWNEAAVPPLGESVSNSELHRRLATAMGFTEPELFEDDLAVLRAAMPSVDLDELRTDGLACGRRTPSDGRPYADGRVPHPHPARSSWSATRWWRWGSHGCRRTRPHASRSPEIRRWSRGTRSCSSHRSGTPGS